MNPELGPPKCWNILHKLPSSAVSHPEFLKYIIFLCGVCQEIFLLGDRSRYDTLVFANHIKNPLVCREDSKNEVW